MKPSTSVAPVVFGPRNSEAATGWPWRWIRDTARALGVPSIGHGQKRGVPAAAFLAALEHSPGTTDVRDGDSELGNGVDPAESIRRALGKKRRAL